MDLMDNGMVSVSQSHDRDHVLETPPTSVMPLFSRPAAESGPAGYMFCFCFLFIYLF